MTSRNSLRYKEKHEANPFIDKKTFVLKKHNASTKEHVISSTAKKDSINQYQHLIARHRLVDNERFIKIYANHVSTWLSLSKRAQAMLSWVLKALRKDKDVIALNTEQIMLETEYKSLGSIYSGINELVESDIMARTTTESLYFINPNFIFNGDRLVLAEIIERQLVEDYTDINQEAIEETIVKTPVVLPEGFEEADKLS